MVLRSGNFAQERIPHESGRPTETLSIDSVYRQRGDAVVGDEGLMHRERGEVTPKTRREFNQRAQEDAVDLLGRLGLGPHSEERFYRLDEEDTYFATFAESVDVPPGHVGTVRPRDNLRSAGVIMDSGFVAPDDDEIEALLFVEDQFVLVAEDAAVAEVVVVEAAEE